MNKKFDFDFIFWYLFELFPTNKTELNYYTPFQLVVAVILSAQSKDSQVNKITQNLYKKVLSPIDIINLWIDWLEKEIKSIWLYKWKTKKLYALSQNLVELTKKFKKNKNKLVNKIFEDYWYFISDDINDLIKLPWIWEKTAKVITHILYWKPHLAVDTHVHRVANRIWFVKTKYAIQTSKLLEKLIPKKHKQIAHHSLIFFWRYFCKARNPMCNDCKLSKICKYFNEIN